MVRRCVASMVLGVLLCGLSGGWALAFETSQAVSDCFAARGVTGTFVASIPAENRTLVHNPERAQTRIEPASTFKIVNTLIGLSLGVVNDVDMVFYRHNGQPLDLKAWEQDMSLREAIRVSNVPAYQELARRIGLDAMQREVTRLEYGNATIGTVVDRFWLQGPLRISALEQAAFLARLAQDALPYPATAQAAVRDICKLESGDGWTLYGKTGLFAARAPKVGWFVGWVERGDRLVTFALNMDMADTNYAVRAQLARECLQALDLL